MWHESLNSSVLNLPNTHDRFTGIKLNLQGQHILAIAAYLPTSGKDDDFLDCLAQLSNFIQENKGDTCTVLIGTDSNCSSKSTPRRLHGFEQFREEHNLLKVCLSEPTFHHSNGQSSSNIDYFLISCNHSLAPNLCNIFSQCTQDYPQNFSSHDPVITTLVVPYVEQECNLEKYGYTYTEFIQSS